jgi:hypothetical protein
VSISSSTNAQLLDLTREGVNGRGQRPYPLQQLTHDPRDHARHLGHVLFEGGQHVPPMQAAYWRRHLMCQLNVADKGALYAEIRRVLRDGGRLALHEIVAGSVQPIHFPVPWARAATLSFLVQPSDLRMLLGATGFRLLAWIDVSGPSLESFKQRLAAAAQPSRPSVGLHLLVGDDFTAMFANVVRNLEENRVAVIQGVFQAPAAAPIR